MFKFSNKHPIYSVTILCLIFLSLAVYNIYYYSDFQTNLLPGVYVQDGPSDLKSPNWSVPLVYDWNNDGLKDLMVGHNHIDINNTNHGFVSFYKNTGTDANPSFNGSVLIQTCSNECSALDAAAFG
jgi:hypothetical protein